MTAPVNTQASQPRNCNETRQTSDVQRSRSALEPQRSVGARSGTRGAIGGARGANGAARELADVATGEVILVQKAAPAPRHGEAFTMLFQDDMLALMCSPSGASMTALQLRVLLTAFAMMGFDNVLALNVTDLAKRLGAHRTSVSRALSALERIGVCRIFESTALGPDNGGLVSIRYLRLTPHIAFRGQVGQRREAVARDTWAPGAAALATPT